MSSVSTDSRADLAGGVARVGHQPGPALHLVRADAHLNTTIYSGILSSSKHVFLMLIYTVTSIILTMLSASSPVAKVMVSVISSLKKGSETCKLSLI